MTRTRIPIAAPGRIGPDELADISEAIAGVVGSGTYVGGPAVARFEQGFAATFGPGFDCVGVGNGLDALTLALVALQLPEGSAVLVPVNDSGFACSAVLAAGLDAVTVDCREDGNVGLEQVQAAWGDRVAGVVVTHLHGVAVHLPPLVEWCHERGVRVIEDCAQAHGAAGVGLYSDAAAFSFYPTKNLGGLGDGGAVVTRNPEIAQRIRSLREYGWGERFLVARQRGRNSRLDAIQAAVLSARIPYLDRNNGSRRRIVAAYRSAAPSRRFLVAQDEFFVGHHAVIVEPRRQDLVALLTARNIGSQVHYPYLVGEMPGLVPAAQHPTPVADALRRQVLSLPCFPGMTDHEIGRVVAALSEWEERCD